MNSRPIGYWQPGRNSTTGQRLSSHRVSGLLWEGHGPGIWGLGHESFTGASPASLLQLRFASLRRCRSRGRLLVRQKSATLLPLTATQWIETKAALKVRGGCKSFFFSFYYKICLHLSVSLFYCLSFHSCILLWLVCLPSSSSCALLFIPDHASIFTFNIWKEYRDSRRWRPFWFEEFSFFLSLIITLDSIIYCEEILFSSQSLCFFSCYWLDNLLR